MWLLLLLCGAAFAAAQDTAWLAGRVRDAGGDPLRYAHVTAYELRPMRGAVTDEQGRFQLALPADTLVAVRFSYSGYATVDTAVRVAAGETLLMELRLEGMTKRLELVTIRVEKSRATTFTTIDMERIEHNVGPQGGVEALLKTLPDVSSNNELSSQYSVRGGSFDENLVYINHVEVYRPQLVRNGQQEGMSIINPDLVERIDFSPGGFDATYGDRMASVLDIAYRRPQQFGGRLSASLLGASATVEGLAGERLTYALGMRYHSNRYLFNSLDTKGNYTTRYGDLQALLSYKVNDKLDLHLMGIATRNAYGLIPEEQTTTFGGFMEVMQFRVYYEGEEADSYRTRMGALTLDYHPRDDMRLRWTTSAQHNHEAELYDILSQFWLYELNVGSINADGETEALDRGIGSFLEHARNYYDNTVFSTELQATHLVRLGSWNWGVKVQHEQVRDRMREWKWVDSAGYAMPSVQPLPGDGNNEPQVPVLQLFCRSNHSVSTSRLMAYAQRNVDFYNQRGDFFSLVAGVRLQAYDIDFSNDNLTGNASNYPHVPLFDDSSAHCRQLLLSPRLSLNYKPKWQRDILLRLAGGVYSQAPAYREYRYDDGTLNHAIRAQRSYQAMGTMDWNFRLGERPFKFTADLYYKYITDLIPYRIDNLRIRYDATNSAVGYAAGLSLRLSGEVVEGLESWASLSLMKTQQDIEGDEYGWLDRPTDQRVNFKVFFQDYVPRVPFWRMSLNFIVGSGLPFTFPGQTDFTQGYRYPAYFRVDWGNTVQLSRLKRLQDSWLMRHVKDVLLTVEVFNLFDYKNVVSYIWVADYNNVYYPVPNYLTARQLSFKLTVTF